MGTEFQVDPSVGHLDEDCWVDSAIVPDPLHEGGSVTWVISNPCGDDPVPSSSSSSSG